MSPTTADKRHLIEQPKQAPFIFFLLQTKVSRGTNASFVKRWVCLFVILMLYLFLGLSCAITNLGRKTDLRKLKQQVTKEEKT